MAKAPANDGPDVTGNDYWVRCLCDSATFHILWRDGLHYVLCRKCQHDMTSTTIWGRK